MKEKELLERSLEEIRTLKQRNHEMGLRLQMFDSVMSIFNASQRSVGGGMMHPNVEWELRKRIDELNQNTNVDDSVKAGRENEQDETRLDYCQSV